MSSRRLNARQRAIVQVLIAQLGPVELMPDRLSRKDDPEPASIDGEAVTGVELRELYDLMEGTYQAEPVRPRGSSKPRGIAVEEEEARLIALGLDELLAAVQNGDWGGVLTLIDLTKAERRWGSLMDLWRDERDFQRRQKELTGTDG